MLLVPIAVRASAILSDKVRTSETARVGMYRHYAYDLYAKFQELDYRESFGVFRETTGVRPDGSFTAKTTTENLERNATGDRSKAADVTETVRYDAYGNRLTAWKIVNKFWVSDAVQMALRYQARSPLGLGAFYQPAAPAQKGRARIEWKVAERMVMGGGAVVRLHADDRIGGATRVISDAYVVPETGKLRLLKARITGYRDPGFGMGTLTLEVTNTD